MDVATSFIGLSTRGNTDIVEITERVRRNLAATKMTEGIATIFAIGSTGGLTTLEFEPGLVKDLKAFFEQQVPEGGRYFHNETWGDGNGYAHVRSALLKTSLSVPFVKGELVLGRWQQIIFADFDNRSRNRQLVTQFIGK